MPEINLPTKAGQDSIKQDTTNILSQFPISGGTDFSVMSQNITRASSNPTTHVEFLSVTGSGYLNSISQQVDSGGVGYVQITVDGVVVFDNALAARNGVSLSLMLRFNQSLVIKHKTNSTSYYSTVAAAYLLD